MNHSPRLFKAAASVVYSLTTLTSSTLHSTSPCSLMVLHWGLYVLSCFISFIRFVLFSFFLLKPSSLFFFLLFFILFFFFFFLLLPLLLLFLLLLLFFLLLLPSPPPPFFFFFYFLLSHPPPSYASSSSGNLLQLSIKALLASEFCYIHIF